MLKLIAASVRGIARVCVQTGHCTWGFKACVHAGCCSWTYGALLRGLWWALHTCVYALGVARPR